MLVRDPVGGVGRVGGRACIGDGKVRVAGIYLENWRDAYWLEFPELLESFSQNMWCRVVHLWLEQSGSF